MDNNNFILKQSKNKSNKITITLYKNSECFEKQKYKFSHLIKLKQIIIIKLTVIIIFREFYSKTNRYKISEKYNSRTIIIIRTIKNIVKYNIIQPLFFFIIKLKITKIYIIRKTIKHYDQIESLRLKRNQLSHIVRYQTRDHKLLQ